MILLINDEHKRSPCPPPSPAALLEEQPQLREDAHGSRPCPAAARREPEMLGEEGMIRDEGTDPTGRRKRAHGGPRPLLTPYPGPDSRGTERGAGGGGSAPGSGDCRARTPKGRDFPSPPAPFPLHLSRARFKLRIQRDIKITPRPPTWEIDSFASHPAPALNIPIYMQIALPPCTAWCGARGWLPGRAGTSSCRSTPPRGSHRGPGSPTGALMLLPKLGGDTERWHRRAVPPCPRFAGERVK